MRASGGGSQSDLRCQIKADVVARPVERLRVRQSGCLGAALMAAAGAGLVDGLAGASARTARVDRVFEPAAEGGRYDELYAIDRDPYLAPKPAHAALAELRRLPRGVGSTEPPTNTAVRPNASGGTDSAAPPAPERGRGGCIVPTT